MRLTLVSRRNISGTYPPEPLNKVGLAPFRGVLGDKYRRDSLWETNVSRKHSQQIFFCPLIAECLCGTRDTNKCHLCRRLWALTNKQASGNGPTSRASGTGPTRRVTGVLGCLLKLSIRDVHLKNSKHLKSADVRYINILLAPCVCFE